MRTFRFGIIGCGQVVQELHLPAWTLIKEAELVAACDPSQDALQAVSRWRASIRQYRDLDAFLSREKDLDFVVLATPGASHLEIGSRVVMNGVRLLCEKPLALTLEDAQRLYDIAEAHGVIVMPIHNYRYRDSVLAALAYKARGEVGDVVHVGVRLRSGSLFDEPGLWRRNERTHRVLLFDFGYHFVDLALLFVSRVSSVSFVEAEVDSMGLQYVVFGTLHEGGERGLFELMLDASCRRTEVEVLGEKGAFALDFFPDGFRGLPPLDTPLHRGFSDAKRVLNHLRSSVIEKLPGKVPRRALPHARVFAAFLQALRQERPPAITKEEVLQTIRLLDQVAHQVYGLAPSLCAMG